MDMRTTGRLALLAVAALLGQALPASWLRDRVEARRRAVCEARRVSGNPFDRLRARR